MKSDLEKIFEYLIEMYQVNLGEYSVSYITNSGTGSCLYEQNR